MRTPFVAAFSWVAGLALASASVPAPAGTDANTVTPLALRQIMKELGRNMQAITYGISREDWVEWIRTLSVELPEQPAAANPAPPAPQ